MGLSIQGRQVEFFTVLGIVTLRYARLEILKQVNLNKGKYFVSKDVWLIQIIIYLTPLFDG